MNSRVRIKDVAQAAEVSVSTVSQVLNGKAAELRIGKETQARVLAIARQMDYAPNRLARDMVLGRRSFIGLVLSEIGLAESALLLPELEPMIASAGYRLILVTIPADPNAASVQVAGLLREGVAGLLCSAAAMPVAVTVAAGTCPVIGLSPTAGRTMLATLRGESVPEKAPVTPVSPIPVQAPTPEPSSQLQNKESAQDGSAGTLRPTEIQEFPQGRAKPPAEPEFIEPAPEPESTPVVVTPVETEPSPPEPEPEPVSSFQT